MMRKIINETLFENGINLFGICQFKSIKKKLIQCRSKELLPEKSESIIVCAFPYKVQVSERNVSRYAVVPDYHKIIRNILNKVTQDLQLRFPDNKFKAFVDNSPIPEVSAAVEAGLGVLGENGLLITEEFGSWVFIGEIVTDLLLDFNKSKFKHCIKCGMCKKFCPSGAIKDGVVNKNICLSNVSQRKGNLSDAEQLLIKKNKCAWGCDVCQEVCPLNKGKPYTYINQFWAEIFPSIKIGDYDILDNRAFQWRPKEVIERNLKILDE